jgi:hypothetical protein
MGYWDDGHMDDGWALAMLFGMLGFGLLIAVAVGLAVLWGSAPRGKPGSHVLSRRPARQCAPSPRERSRSWPSDWRAARLTRRSTRLG